MKLSRYYLPILRNNPSDAVSISHRLMLRSGMIRQTANGIYSMLPLGFRVLQKISNIIRKHLANIGCIEMLMPIVQTHDLWSESLRSDAYGSEILRAKDRHGKDLLYSPTNEELIIDIFRKDITSYKAMPLNLYQIQWKFRDEIRPRFGVMRGREFLMMDGYSFDITELSAFETYNTYYDAFLNIFEDMGLTVIPVRANTGAIGGDLSHEFHALSESGESVIFYDTKMHDFINNRKSLELRDIMSLYAKTKDEHEMLDASIANEIVMKRGIEIGHIFYFGSKYSKIMNTFVLDCNVDKVAPLMGSYGIGVSRLMGAAIECNNDEHGIIWHESISPFKIMLINLDAKNINSNVCKFCESLYRTCLLNDLEILFDDTEGSVGSKLSTADLIGIPYQVIVGDRSFINNVCEIKCRKNGIRRDVALDSIAKILTEDGLSNLFN